MHFDFFSSERLIKIHTLEEPNIIIKILHMVSLFIVRSFPWNRWLAAGASGGLGAVPTLRRGSRR